jgi:hypothetical protein
MFTATLCKANDGCVSLFLIVERNGEKTYHNNSLFRISKKLIELDVMELIDVLKEPIE